MDFEINNIFNYKNEGWFLIPEIIYLFFLILFIFFFSVFYTIKNDKFFINFSNLISYVLFLVYLFELIYMWNQISLSFVLLNYSYIYDNYIIVSKIILLCFILLFWLIFRNFIDILKLYNYEVFLLIFTSIFGLFLLISSYDFINFYLALELYSLSVYGVIAHYRNNILNLESSIKYFFIGSISSILILFSFAVIYATFGTINFVELEIFMYYSSIINVDENMYFIFFCVLIVISLLIKIGAAPYHLWSLDSYNGAPFLIMLFLIIISKFAIIIVIFRLILFNFFELWNLWKYLLFFFIITCIFVGCFGSLYQFKFRRIIIYSSIYNISFFLSIIAVNNIFNMVVLWFFSTIYFINIFSFFLFVSLIINYTNYKYLNKIDSVINIFNNNFWKSLSFIFIIFSLMGLPPFSSFLAKFLVLVLFCNYYYINIIFLILIIGTVISTFYYLRLLKMSFSFVNNFTFIKSPKFVLSFLLSILSVSLILFSLYFGFFFKIFWFITIFNCV